MRKFFSLLCTGFIALNGFSLGAEEESQAPALQIRLVVEQATDESEPLVLPSTRAQDPKEILNVMRPVLLAESHVKSALATTDKANGNSQINLKFTETGKRQFAKVTKEHMGERLAIVLDGKLLSAPLIQTEIAGGEATIAGSFTDKEARELAAKITKLINKP